MEGWLYRSGEVLKESVYYLMFGVLTQMRLSQERERQRERGSKRNNSLKMSSTFHLNSDGSNTVFKKYINYGILKISSL